MKSTHFSIIATLALSTIVSCSDDESTENHASAEQQAFRSSASIAIDYLGNSDVVAFSVAVFEGGTNTPALPATIVNLQGPVLGLPIKIAGTNVDPASGHQFSLLEIEIDPGVYDISITPMRDDGQGGLSQSLDCAFAHAVGVTVLEGQVSEFSVVSQCAGPQGTGSSGIDGTILLNHAPAIDVTTSARFSHACVQLEACASVVDGDNDPLRVTWSLEGAGGSLEPIFDSAGNPITPAGSDVVPVSVGALVQQGQHAGVHVFQQCASFGFSGSGTKRLNARVHDLVPGPSAGDPAVTIESLLVQAGSSVLESHDDAAFGFSIGAGPVPKCIDAAGNPVPADPSQGGAVAPGCTTQTDAEFYCDPANASTFGFDIDSVCPGHPATAGFNPAAIFPPCDGVPEVCGNGILEPGEECDAGPLNDDSGACTESCQLAFCGDTLLHSGIEECDGSNLGGATCSSAGFGADGSLGCTATCQFDPSDCSNCGDNVVQGGELCDGSDLAGATCQDLGFSAAATGAPSCADDCGALQVGSCEEPGSVCGDNLADPGERCDGSDLNGGDCEDAGFTAAATGAPTCNDACDGFNPGTCEEPSASCGDGVAQGSEICDSGDLNGGTCQDAGFSDQATGAPDCNESCDGFDAGTCQEPTPVCGDDVAQGDEVCDGSDLKAGDCQDAGFSANATGTPTCNDACDGFEAGTCQEPIPTCGNDIAEAPELCDGTDLNGGTCQDAGFTAAATGSPTCNAGCDGFEAGTCEEPSAVCGDGSVDDGEDCEPTVAVSTSCEELKGTGSTGTVTCSDDCSFVASCSPGYTEGSFDPATEFEDIGSAAGVNTLSLTDEDDGVSAQISLGFAFPLFGENYDQMQIGANGGLMFSQAGDPAWPNLFFLDADLPDELGNASIPAAVLGLWFDQSAAAPQANIYYLDDSANDRFIVQYDAVGHAWESPAFPDRWTHQTILFADGRVELRYVRVDRIPTTPPGANGYGIGLQAAGAGGEALQITAADPGGTVGPVVSEGLLLTIEQ